MKKIFSIALAGLALASVVACSDEDYDSKYENPEKTETVGVPQVFTAVMFKGNTWMNPVYYRYYTQTTTSGTFSGVIGTSNGRGRFRGASEGYFNTRWKNFYDMLTQYRLMEKTYNENEAEKEVNTVFHHLGRTLVEAQLHEMLSLFGDVPYNTAATLWESGDYQDAKTKAVYDDDVDLYKQILSDLKETGDWFAAGSVSSAGVTSLTVQDYSLAGGNTKIWQKYVNSLRLRIALHLATNGDLVSEARAAIAEILNNPSKYPLIDSNDENMGVAADTQTDNFNYGKSTSQCLHTTSFSTVSQAFVDAFNVPAGGVPDENTDPRIAAMLDCNPDGQYVSYDPSLTDTEISNISQAAKNKYNEKGLGTSPNYYCVIDSQAVAGWAEYQGNTKLNGIWLSAAEVSFSKAEAYLMGYGVTADEAKAKECFIKGYEQSAEYYWNLKTTSSLYKEGNDSYYAHRDLTVPTAADFTAYAEKIWKPTQECICTQLWLNHGFMNELEAWNVTRRTGYPVVTFQEDKVTTSYPTPPNRLPYPSDEINYNTDNYNAAVAKNYEESTGYYTNLFWAKKNYYNLVK